MIDYIRNKFYNGVFMSEEFDVVFIGGGPAGYIGSIRAAQLGFKTACVEYRGSLGGTCLNVGCIPSKALLQSSHLYSQAAKEFSHHGINVSGLNVDIKSTIARKAKVVSDLCNGIEGLFKKNKVTYIKGFASFKSKNELSIKNNDGTSSEIKFKNAVIATGSEVASLPNIKIDEKRIISSTGALNLSEIPKSMVVIGAGYIGLEMGSVWSRFGTEVTVVEYLDKIVPSMDLEIGKQLHKALESQGMKFKLSAKVLDAKVTDKDVTLTIEPSAGGEKSTITADVVLVAVGRRPYTDNLNLESAGVKLDPKGRILVDGHYMSSCPRIYAVGDVIDGPMLAHKAEEEAVAAVEFIAGQKPHINYNAIPGVIYTHPEAAGVGKTEEELKSAGVNYKAGKFPFMANSRARANGDTFGMVKILSCAKTDKILGAHIIGPEAGSIIHELVLAIEFGAASEDVARTCHAHPTLSEAIKEASLSVLGRTLNI